MALINFVVISLVVFSVMRTIQNLRRQEEISTTAAAATDPQLLLAEAADRLAKALESRQL